MTNLGRLFGVLTLSATAACGVGDDAPPPSTPDPRICSANLSITGNFTLGMPAPDLVNNDTQMPPADGLPDVEGCWPVGTWTWTMAVVDNTCQTPPTPAPSYSFRTDYVLDANNEPTYTYSLIAPTSFPNYRLKVSSGGGGLCEGVIEFYTADGLESWILHPALDSFNMNGPLDGLAEYAQWSDAQYP